MELLLIFFFFRSFLYKDLRLLSFGLVTDDFKVTVFGVLDIQKPVHKSAVGCTRMAHF